MDRYIKDFVVHLKPNASSKRYPESDDLTHPIDGFYIHNLSAYTVYANIDVVATGSEQDIPIPTVDWRDIGLVAKTFISVYCASNASAVGADVVIIGYRRLPDRVIPIPVPVYIAQRPPPAKAKPVDKQFYEGEFPEYLKVRDE